MNRVVIVNKIPGEKRVAIIEDRKLVELHIMRADTGTCLGNIYSGIVKRVLPGMQSAFVEFGGSRTGFIYVNDLKADITYEEFQKSFDDDEDPEENSSPEPAKETRKADITQFIKEGQKVLVQVIKEPIGQKGARLTTHISLPGRFCVLMPTILHIGISRKITDRDKRDELKDLGRKVQNKGYGIIMRTLAAESESKVIEKEAVSLIKRWTSIQGDFKKEKNAAVLYSAPDPVIEIVQNTDIKDLKEIIADNHEDEKNVRDYLSFYNENPDDIVKFYDLPYPVFDYYSIESEIANVLKKKIWLKSGGFLIIEQTEALTVIDVNTGKFIGKGNLESTVLKTNLEAVDEIAYHLRLRNIAGIIVVDFIDMRNQNNKKKVITELEKLLEKDPAKCSVFYFTRLGLIQITRKRTTESNISSMTEPCPYCSGNGIIRSRDTIAFQIFRDIQRQVKLYGSRVVSIEAHPDAVFSLEHKHSDELKELVRELRINIEVQSNNSFHREHYIVSDKNRN